MRTALLIITGILLNETVVKGQIPHTPVLYWPVDGATDVAYNMLTLIWHDVSGASSYDVEVSIDSAFSSFVFRDSMVADTFTMIGTLSAMTVYYWRVNASNPGQTGPWSATWSFTTAPMTTIRQFPVEIPKSLLKPLTVYSLSGRVISKKGTSKYRSMTSGFYIYKTGDQIKKTVSSR
jgi:hypothetical protein